MISHASNLEQQISLRQTAPAICDIGWLDVPDQAVHNVSCNMFSGFLAIPSLTVALYSGVDGNFTLCCDDVAVSFSTQLFKGNVEIPLTGQKTLETSVNNLSPVIFRLQFEGEMPAQICLFNWERSDSGNPQQPAD